MGTVVLGGVVCGVPSDGQEQVTLRDGGNAIMPMEEPSPAEQHLRAGVVILAKLYRCLAEVTNSQTAQSAVPSVVQITRDLQTWIQNLHGMKLPAKQQEILEHNYLPIIAKINGYIEVQGERLAAASYYGSQDLATALIALYITVQQ